MGKSFFFPRNCWDIAIFVAVNIVIVLNYEVFTT